MGNSKRTETQKEKEKKETKMSTQQSYSLAPLILIAVVCTLNLCLTITHEIEHNNNQISFPFRTVGVDSDTGSASTSILKKEFPDEYETIMAAAYRNACEQENLLILFAIRKAENGPPGLEFGSMCQAGTDLDTQAGWAAATIMKNRERWTKAQDKLFGYKGFIIFLGNRYCPTSVDPQGNINWIRNVTYWYERFKNGI